MKPETERVQLFNPGTMSGVTPGIRTRIMQRVQLVAVGAQVDDTPAAGWVRLLWYAAPQTTEQATEIEGATCLVQRQSRTGADEWSDKALVVLDNVAGTDLNHAIQAALADHGYALRGCASCSRWREIGVRNEHGLPVGLCTAAAVPETPATPDQLARQALFAPACRHWDATAGPLPAHPPRVDAYVAPLPRAAVLHKEKEEARHSLWHRLRRTVEIMRSATTREGTVETGATDRLETSWSERLVERSGVGAGTEPCFACQGRIANLGALTVATDQNDKHTYSVWRCRSCYATYLNSWIDRWERLDNLETEETYYRLAPTQAVEALAVIDGVVGGEHPAGRNERQLQRLWFERFAHSLPVLSHQLKQGR